MEQVLKKILNVLNELKSDVNTLKTEQVKVNERLTRIEYKVDKLEIGQKEIKKNIERPQTPGGAGVLQLFLCICPF